MGVQNGNIPLGSDASLLTEASVEVTCSFTDSLGFSVSGVFESAPVVYLGKGLPPNSSLTSSGNEKSHSLFGNGSPSESF